MEQLSGNWCPAKVSPAQPHRAGSLWVRSGARMKHGALWEPSASLSFGFSQERLFQKKKKGKKSKTLSQLGSE